MEVDGTKEKGCQMKTLLADQKDDMNLFLHSQ